MLDQAAKLRNLVLGAAHAPLARPRNAPHLALMLGGKGGVGVTTLAVNLSVALAAHSLRVILVDADLYRADIALLCRLRERRTLMDILDGACAITDALQPGPGGVQVLPGIWAPERDPKLDQRSRQRLLQQLQGLGSQFDVVLFDAGSTGPDLVQQIWPATDDVLLVTTPDAVAIMDCYATIKVALQRAGDRCSADGPSDVERTLDEVPDTPVSDGHCRHRPQLRLITNQATDAQQAAAIFERIDRSTQRFLGCSVDPIGSVPFQPQLADRAPIARLLVQDTPTAPAATAIHQIAAVLARKWKLPRTQRTNGAA